MYDINIFLLHFWFGRSSPAHTTRCSWTTSWQHSGQVCWPWRRCLEESMMIDLRQSMPGIHPMVKMLSGCSPVSPLNWVSMFLLSKLHYIEKYLCIIWIYNNIKWMMACNNSITGICSAVAFWFPVNILRLDTQNAGHGNETDTCIKTILLCSTAIYYSRLWQHSHKSGENVVCQIA